MFKKIVAIEPVNLVPKAEEDCAGMREKLRSMKTYLEMTRKSSAGSGTRTVSL